MKNQMFFLLILVFFVSFITNSFAQRNVKNKYFLSVELSGIMSPIDISESDISSNPGIGFNFQFLIDKRGNTAQGISLGFFTTSYSHKDGWYQDSTVNLSYVYLPVTYCFKYYSSRKLDENKYFFFGNMGYSFVLNDSEYQGDDISAGNGFIITSGYGYSIVYNTQSSIDIGLEACVLFLDGFKIIGEDNPVTLLAKLSVAYKFNL